jgi:DNA-binding MarR family transcriptional regulator
LLNRHEHAGQIERRRNLNDRRRKLIAFTAGSV